MPTTPSSRSAWRYALWWKSENQWNHGSNEREENPYTPWMLWNYNLFFWSVIQKLKNTLKEIKVFYIQWKKATRACFQHCSKNRKRKVTFTGGQTGSILRGAGEKGYNIKILIVWNEARNVHNFYLLVKKKKKNHCPRHYFPLTLTRIIYLPSTKSASPTQWDQHKRILRTYVLQNLLFSN